MVKQNFNRKGCKDVYNAFLVSCSNFSGYYDFPRLNPTYDVPNKLISFSKSLSNKSYDQWIHFYEDDFMFERVWRNPKRYLSTLKKYNGVILPDFSLYRDMPYVMQLWNIYRSRAIGTWLQNNGIKVIPNIRFGDRRTEKVCCDGISKKCIIAVGSHGTLKNREDRKIFTNGLENVVTLLQPIAIIVYGSAPKNIFDKYKNKGIEVIQFESDISQKHKVIKEQL